MNNQSNGPITGRGRLLRWGIGVTLAGFLAGGGYALAAGTSSGAPAPENSSAQLSALTSLSNATSTQTASKTATTTATKTPGTRGLGALRRLRGLGGMYGSFTFQTKSGDETLAFERGTITSVSNSDIVVQAADGTTITWLLVSDTVVRDHGTSNTSVLSDGQLVFVGGPVVNGARDARLIVVRAPKTTTSVS
jgi:hypothetical protein